MPDVGTFEPITGVPGVTDEAINFAVLGTGPSNPLGYCLLECYKGGVQAYFDYQNGLGGVNGRQLVISRTDDDEVGNTQVKALELIDDDTHLRHLRRTAAVRRLHRHRRRRRAAVHHVPGRRSTPTASTASTSRWARMCVECASPVSRQRVRRSPAARRPPRSATACRRRRRTASTGRVGVRHVGRRRRRRVRLQEQRPAVRLPQRPRARGDRHEGGRRRLHHHVHRPERRADRSNRSSSARAWTT